MTVNTTNITAGPYTGNGLSDEYSYGFRVTDKTQLSVYETTDLGVRTLLVVDTDYTVAGIGVDAGGIITRVAGNLPTDYIWYIRSDYDDTQLSALSSQGPFFPDVHEDVFDKRTFVSQQLQDAINRAFRLSDEVDIDGTFTIDDDAGVRAGKFLTFDANGNLITSATSLLGDSLVLGSKAEVVVLALTAADAGRKIFITSDDGGEFTVRHNATPGTYADTGGAYTGTQFIPSGGDGTIGIVRDFSGVVNVIWFGAKGDVVTNNTTSMANCRTYVKSIGGGVMSYPAGTYAMTTFPLSALIKHIGEGQGVTTIKALAGGSADGFVSLDQGPVNSMGIKDMSFDGDNAVSGQIGFRIEALASASSPFDGGLWFSVFENIDIANFDGHTCWFKGGATGSLLPNQFNKFINVISRRPDNTTSRNLLMTGQNAQNIFSGGAYDGGTIGVGTNIELSRQFTNGGTVGGASVGGSADGDNSPSSNEFIHKLTSQTAETAVSIDRASGNTLDLWLENLYRAITINSASTGTVIRGSRFANACSDGASGGYGVSVGASCGAVIHGNTITGNQDEFITGSSHRGIIQYGNIGVDDATNKTSGIVPNLVHSAGVLTTHRNGQVVVNASTSAISTITSGLHTGEPLTLRVFSAGYLVFNETGNLALPDSTTILRTGDSITFRRDDFNGDNFKCVGTSIAKLEASAMPSSGYYVIGEFVWMNTPVQAAGKLLLGWSRLVTGSAHVLNTDWSACYVTTT